MSKYIDADALMEYLKQNWEPINDSFPMSFTLDQIKESLDEMPAADVEPARHGHWLKDDETGNEMVRCSICHEVYDCEESTELFSQFYHYCPNCGAKMDGGSE